MKKLKLLGKTIRYALVDDEDFELVSKYQWSVAASSDYVKREFGGRHQKRKVIRLDDLLIEHGPGFHVIHKDGDKLDCRKENLLAVPKKTLTNRRNWVGKSGFRGVSIHQNRYQAHIRIRGKLIYLGSYKRI